MWVMAALIVGIILGITLGFYAATPKHKWKYRNPYDRTCSACGRHEVKHSSNFTSSNRSWWEVFNDGEPSKHNGR